MIGRFNFDSLKNTILSCFRFRWNFVTRVQLTTFIITGSEIGLMPNRWNVIKWTNADSVNQSMSRHRCVKRPGTCVGLRVKETWILMIKSTLRGSVSILTVYLQCLIGKLDAHQLDHYVKKYLRNSHTHHLRYSEATLIDSRKSLINISHVVSIFSRFLSLRMNWRCLYYSQNFGEVVAVDNVSSCESRSQFQHITSYS